MKIKVEARDIERGRIARESKRSVRCLSCPIANALFRATGRGWLVSVDFAVADRSPLKEAIALPAEVTAAIQRFDKDLHMDPFQFELAVAK